MHFQNEYFSSDQSAFELFCKRFSSLWEEDDVLYKLAKTDVGFAHIDEVRDQDFWVIYDEESGCYNQDVMPIRKKKQLCFCDPQCSTVYPLSTYFSALLQNYRAILFTKKCVPEPDELFFIEFLDILNKIFHLLRRENKTFVVGMNLKGSGASIPTHLHFQLIPIHTNGMLSTLMKNYRENSRNPTVKFTNKLRISEANFPTWRLRLDYTKQLSTAVIARLLYITLQKNMRERSKFNLSYNIIIDSNNPTSIHLIPRDVEGECPLADIKINSLLRTILGCQHKISNERSWKFGWLEMLGCFLVKENELLNRSAFDHNFWKATLLVTTVKTRELFLNQILKAFQTQLK